MAHPKRATAPSRARPLMHPTSKFHNALPYILLPVAPSLAALHSSRVRAHSHTPGLCSSCGSYLFHGSGHVRAVRVKKSKSKARALRVACRTCGCCEDFPFDRDAAFSQPAPDPESSTPLPLMSNQGPPIDAARIKARPKKKTGLMDMLARNREKEQRELAEKSGQGGLAAFLSGL